MKTYFTIKVLETSLTNNKKIQSLFEKVKVDDNNNNNSNYNNKNKIDIDRIKVNIVIQESELPTIYTGKLFKDKGNVIGTINLQHYIYRINKKMDA